MRVAHLVLSGLLLCVACNGAVQAPGAPGTGSDAPASLPAPVPQPGAGGSQLPPDPPPARPPAPNAAAAICPYPGPTTCNGAPPAVGPIVCVPELLPDPPVFPPPQGDVGPCEDLEYTAPDSVSGYRFVLHVRNSWDDRGHVIAQTSFAEDGTTSFSKSRRYDECGHLIWEETRNGLGISQIENEYSPDGYLVRHAESSSNGSCQAESFAWSFDANGKVDALLDGQSCGWMTRYYYDLGRLTGVSWLTGGTGFTYFPDGKMSGWDSSGMSISESHEYDEAGAPVFSTFNNDVGASSRTQWSYGPAHELLEVDGNSSGGCGGPATRRTFRYDAAGRLLREEEMVTRYSCVGDPPVTHVTTTDYSWPAPDLQIAEAKDEAGELIKRTRTVFDARGNTLEVDMALAPDFTWLVVSRRNYDCWAP